MILPALSAAKNQILYLTSGSRKNQRLFSFIRFLYTFPIISQDISAAYGKYRLTHPVGLLIEGPGSVIVLHTAKDIFPVSGYQNVRGRYAVAVY